MKNYHNHANTVNTTYEILFQSFIEIASNVEKVSDELFQSCQNQKMTKSQEEIQTGQSFINLLPGFPGTQEDALVYFENAVNALLNHFRNHSINAKRLLYNRGSNLEVQEETQKAQKTLKDMMEIANKSKNVKAMVKQLASKNSELIQKVDKFSKKKNNKLKKPKLVKTAKAKKYYKFAKEERNKGIKEAETFKTSANSLYQDFTTRAISLIEIFKNRNQMINQMIQELSKANTDFASSVFYLSSDLCAKTQEIDYFSDFKKFVDVRKIIRYDLQNDPFIPIDISHPVFSTVNTKIYTPVMPHYPIAIGQMIGNFTAESENEMSAAKGKAVLLMEPKDQNWVLVMNPITRNSGYVPASFINLISTSIGVIKDVSRSLTDKGFNFSRGDYVGIVGESQYNFSAVSVNGSAVEIPKEIVAKISE
ncbi:hypothetical protein TRFO_22636 [Tritrichomonas foetus]|uniref:SH3 domain-containing protein n=1 Tax=Tritrichomonas foetus TaxID=1144522 RepID=A0A1J4KC33_9EUKA|nr:hypothetical protein TRFO_22636 [Tritrichomonas foetus]|eukprot:OHT08787.1 hypothetical protein TRFO_22636 [Tritrichomonas foetus]